MARITTLVQPIEYKGQPLPIQGAAFMENVISIATLSPNGQGFITTTSSFPTFDYLLPGVVYFIRSMQVPYDIPEVLPADAPVAVLALTTDTDFIPV